MAVGMTLHQLYSQTAPPPQQPPHQTYDNDHHTMNSSADNCAVSGPAPQQPPHVRSKSPDKAGASAVHYESSNSMHHHHHHHHPHAAYQVAPSHYQAPPQQQQQHYGYSNQYQSKSADDYAADPLPFEYHGVRKYTDTYAPQPHHHAPQYSMSKSLDSRQQQAAHGAYAPHYAPHPSDRSSHYHPVSEISAHFPHASHHQHHHHSSSSSAHMFGSQLTHSFPPLIDPKKEITSVSTSLAPVSATAPTVVVSADAVYAPPPSSSSATTASQAIAAAVSAHSEYHQATSSSSVQASSSSSVASVVGSGTAQEAMIKVKTPLKTKYWRNGRRNLQCFPSCKVFGDYSAIKIEDLKQHDFMWGKCRGSIVTEVTLNSSVSFDDIVILGRVHSLENIPVAFEEAVIRECMLGRMVEPDVMDAMKDQWISGERLPDFVQHDGHTACFEFKPKVWKYTEDMAQGKCKRRNVKYYVQFEAFVLVMAGERRYYACIGSGMSTSFEVGSSRVLARQKRKAATTTTATDELKHSGSSNAAPGHPDAASSMQSMHHAMMAPHAMLSTSAAQPPPLSHHHSMAPSGMFQAPFHHAHLPQQHSSAGLHESMGGASRGLPAFPQMAPPLQQTPQLHQSMGLESAHHGGAPVAPVAGTKRKASSDRQAFPTERAPKQLKAMAVPSSM